MNFTIELIPGWFLRRQRDGRAKAGSQASACLPSRLTPSLVQADCSSKLSTDHGNGATRSHRASRFGDLRRPPTCDSFSTALDADAQARVMTKPRHSQIRQQLVQAEILLSWRDFATLHAPRSVEARAGTEDGRICVRPSVLAVVQADCAVQLKTGVQLLLLILTVSLHPAGRLLQR